MFRSISSLRGMSLGKRAFPCSTPRHDGVSPSPSQGFARCKLDNKRRDDLLGQASILTLAAIGVDTSPVIRGVSLLENISGASPSPPPPNVPVVKLHPRCNDAAAASREAS
jgi:hypothetical protein